MSNYELLSLWAAYISAGGVVIAMSTLLFAVWQYRKDRDLDLFDGSHREYLDYLSICIEHPQIDLFVDPIAEPQSLTPEQERIRDIAFAYKIAFFERAYLLQTRTKSSINIAVSEEWHDYIIRYTRREAFREIWNTLRPVHDNNFSHWFDKFVEEGETLSRHS